MSKYNVGLKTLLLQGLSEPEFYGDLGCKFRKIIGKYDFLYHFNMIIVRYKKIGYNIPLGDRHVIRIVLGQAYRGLTGGFLSLRIFSVAISVSPHVCFVLVLILISMFLKIMLLWARNLPRKQKTNCQRNQSRPKGEGWSTVNKLKPPVIILRPSPIIWPARPWPDHFFG